MQKLQCELCGSVDFVRTDDGFFKCEACGCKYTLEQAKTVISGEVKVSPTDFTIRGGVLEKYNGAAVDVVIPDNVTIIGESAFKDCQGITSVTIPNSVKKIELDAFSFCTNLKAIHINSLSAWCSISFNYDFDLLSKAELCINGNPISDHLVVPNGVTSIGANAFRVCKGLTSINIPNSVTSIGCGAFKGCTGLISINIPNSVTSIEGGAFVGGAFVGCTGLTSINIPNSVTSIGDRAFEGCTGLTSINIPNSVTYIGMDAFKGCTGLTSINIPNSVTDIGMGVFAYCYDIKTISFPVPQETLKAKYGYYIEEKEPCFIEYLFSVKCDNSKYRCKYHGPSTFERLTVTAIDNREAVIKRELGSSDIIGNRKVEETNISDFLKQLRKEAGRCTLCGGEFKDTLFGKKCSYCGTRKEY